MRASAGARALIQVERAVEPPSAMRHSAVVLRVACVLAHGVVRGQRLPGVAATAATTLSSSAAAAAAAGADRAAAEDDVLR